VLAAYIPGGQERSFEEFGRLPPDVVAQKYDSEFVGDTPIVHSYLAEER
jgi:hypothetical protein